MARLVCGVDVGTAGVRGAVVKVGLGAPEVVATVEADFALPEDGSAVGPDEIGRALRAVAQALPTGPESVRAAVPGDAVTLRLLRFPRAALRQAEAAIRIELEGQLPFELSEAVVDHRVVSPAGEDPALVLALIARTDLLRGFAAPLAAAGLEPAALTVGALPLANLLPPKDPALQKGTLALLDVGRTVSDLAVLRDGRLAFVRAFRAGGEDVTRAVAKTFGMGRAEAEAVKCGRLVFPAPGEPVDPGIAALVEAGRNGWNALLGPLRRTLIELRGRNEDPLEPARLLVTGGGASGPGLAAFLAERLGLPVERLEESAAPTRGLAPERLGRFARAVGTAVDEAAPRTRRVDLRKGDLRFHGEAAALRARFRGIAAGLLLVLATWILFVWARGRSLDREADRQRTALEEVTREAMGRRLSDFDQVRSMLQRSGRPVDGPLPKADVLDILSELARTVPSDIRHSITSIDIGPGKIAINGRTRNAEEAARIPKVLEAFDLCVRDVGTLSGSGSEGDYTYQIEATTECP